MSDGANLKAKTIEALRHYREALAKVEDLEKEEANARCALKRMLNGFECAIFEHCASSVRQQLIRKGQATVSRLSEVSDELTEATAKLDASGRHFAALEKQLGYIPVVPVVRAGSKDLEHCSNGD